MKTIKTDDLKKMMDKNEVTVIEVLENEEYKKSHIKGAINIPQKKISHEARNRFNKDDKIVVYCSDSKCKASSAAGKKLEESGFNNIYHYKGGKKEWKESGMPMD